MTALTIPGCQLQMAGSYGPLTWPFQDTFPGTNTTFSSSKCPLAAAMATLFPLLAGLSSSLSFHPYLHNIICESESFSSFLADYKQVPCPCSKPCGENT